MHELIERLGERFTNLGAIERLAHEMRVVDRHALRGGGFAVARGFLGIARVEHHDRCLALAPDRQREQAGPGEQLVGEPRLVRPGGLDRRGLDGFGHQALVAARDRGVEERIDPVAGREHAQRARQAFRADRVAQRLVDQRGQKARADRPGADFVLARIAAVEQPPFELDDRAVEVVDAAHRQRRVGRTVIPLQFEPVARIAVEQIVARGFPERIGVVAEVERLDEGCHSPVGGARSAQLARIGQRHADGGDRKAPTVMIEQTLAEPVPPAELHVARRHRHEPRRQERADAACRFHEVAQPLDRLVDLVEPQHVLDRKPKVVLDHAIDGDDLHAGVLRLS